MSNKHEYEYGNYSERHSCNSDNLKVEISVPMGELFHALGFIQTLQTKNQMKFKLTIRLDYISDSAGTYFYDFEPSVIYLNPDQCAKNESYGYVEDDSLFGTAIHEFCHFLTMHYFKNFKEEYLKEFPEERIILTSYKRAQQDYYEEVAEVLSLHLRNPYFLKLIYPIHYEFMKQYIKPYVACTPKKFIEIYNQMEQRDKEKCFKKWNIIVNHHDQTVIKV
jgi:hypothetical protein